jgi:outer membrane receptor protein involved in Fe transport
MDFSGGPTSGQDAEKLQSAIEWIRGEFLRQLPEYLTPEQLKAWSSSEASNQPPAAAGATAAPPAAAAQTQFVRINNNPFTAEDVSYSRRGQGSSAEVIPRGGAGAWHGDTEFFLKDDDLNARNAFAANKPIYQERQFSVDVGGPVVRNRLSSRLTFSHNEAENVDTIHATLPEGLFALGITRPVVTRTAGTESTYQLAEAHSLTAIVEYTTTTRENEAIGAFNLPERASNSESHGWNVELRQFSALSPSSFYETRVSTTDGGSATIPVLDAPRIDVLDAFGRGGAQNQVETASRTYGVDSLYTRLGERLTMKAGMEANYERKRSISTENFGGTFTFANIEAFRAGRAISYRVNRGNPLLDVRQWDLGAFVQHDLVVNSQLTLMFGGRYDLQNNLTDRNNVSGRVGFAYGAGRATVIRGGAGLFYAPLDIEQVELQRRFDGARQFEVIIDNASYPDPLESGTVRQRFPSIRVEDPNLRNAETLMTMFSVERTFPRNLFIAATYELKKEWHLNRLTNLNAPYDATAPVRRSCRPEQPAETCVRPDPGRGNIVMLESTGWGYAHWVRLRVRQRVGIFNLSADYLLDKAKNNGSALARELPTDSWDIRSDYGNRIQPRHTVDGTVNARLPYGVFLATQLSGNTGRFYTITTGRDDNRDTSINDRPPGVARNTARAPAYFNVNVNLSKAFFLSGAGSAGVRKNVNLFANVTNVFNWVHYGLPSGVMTSPNFGRSTSALDPRDIEIGVRFQF